MSYWTEKNIARQVLDPDKLIPVGHFSAVAVAHKSAAHKKNSPNRELVRAGSLERNISHDFEPGWRPALRMKQGTTYLVEYWEVPDAKPDCMSLPKDEKHEEGLVFFAIAHAMKGKDEFDARRSLSAYIGAWTDGVMLRTPATLSPQNLVLGKVYKVRVTALPANA